MRIALSRTYVSIAVLIVLLGGPCISSAGPRPKSAITVLVDAQTPGAKIPDDFSGLSFEMQMLLPGEAGSHYFDASNHALIQTFHNLGVKSLRVGGNTADEPNLPFPAIRDTDSLFAFARAVPASVIFTFRLRAGSPGDAAPIAKHLTDQYSSSIDCFEIGNEPDVYIRTYRAYRDQVKRYMEAFSSFGISPGAKFCGPGTTPSKAEWAREFSQDFGHSKRIRYVTQHAYPGNSGRTVTDPAAGRSAILSQAWVDSYENFYRSFAHAAQVNQLPYRMEETNNYYHGGARDVSDTFASALWGLDYMHWWAMNGAAGVNFHTGDQVAAADEITKCFYAAFLASSEGYAIQPLGYAMKAFDLGGHGRIVPVRLTSGSHTLNLTAYGVLSEDKTLYVTLINKEHGPDQRDVMVTVLTPAAYVRADFMRLENSTGDNSAKTGLALGGAAMKDNAVWNGVWTTVGGPTKKGGFEVGVAASSATVLRFTRHVSTGGPHRGQ